ncbi:MAG: gamma-butyrobetaine,2-oxoglutarate dioxygenase, partial [Acidimicrobiia bacterium]|nr:gamma-butyrobetaine,2-oxoglutarate dioxygenase [Acidimicrobiia bacterium]
MIRWPDGAELRAYSLWLFENRMDDQAIDEQTRENKLDPAHLPRADVLAGATVAANGDLCVSWHGYPNSLFHSGWLRHIYEGHHGQTAYLPAVQTWTVATMPQLPTFDGPAVLTDDDALRVWLTTLVELGVARLTGLSNETETVANLGQRIGALRDTNFGTTWSVSV